MNYTKLKKQVQNSGGFSLLDLGQAVVNAIDKFDTRLTELEDNIRWITRATNYCGCSDKLCKAETEQEAYKRLQEINECDHRYVRVYCRTKDHEAVLCCAICNHVKQIKKYIDGEVITFDLSEDK
jgi:hypothetical protein